MSTSFGDLTKVAIPFMPATKSNDINLELSLSTLRPARPLHPTPEGRSIENHQIVERARQLLLASKKFAAMGPRGLFRGSSWDMMLELFISGEEGRVLYVKQMMIASGESPTAAMRRIDRLDEAGFIVRIPDLLDQRRVIVRLTEAGRSAILEVLDHAFDPAPAPAIAFRHTADAR